MKGNIIINSITCYTANYLGRMTLCKSIAWLRQSKTNTSDNEEFFKLEKVEFGDSTSARGATPDSIDKKVRTATYRIKKLRLNCEGILDKKSQISKNSK